MKIILLGPPGAGKGTQAEFICQDQGIAQISTGEMLRTAIVAGTLLGKRVRDVMASGAFVDDHTIIALVKDRIALPDCQSGFLFDGFPRTIAQAQALVDAGIAIDHVVEVQVADDVVVRRISGRRVHEPSGRIYHVVFDPPRTPDIDDETGEPLTQRADDNERTVRQRLRLYRAETQPLVRFYKNMAATSATCYSTICGNGTVKGTKDAIAAALSLACGKTNHDVIGGEIDGREVV